MNDKAKLRQLFLVVLTAVMITVMPLHSFAAESVPQSVSKDKEGVVEVSLVYTGENGEEYVLQTGSGFLIHETYVAAMAYTVQPDSEYLETYAEYFGIDTDSLLGNIHVMVSKDDVNLAAAIVTSNPQTYLAVLKLKDSLSGCKPLSLISAESLSSSDACYSLGISSIVSMDSDSKEVSISQGIFKKITSIADVEYVVSSASPETGSNGGPLVDANGNVIGIVAGMAADGEDNMACYAVTSDTLIKTLDRLGIAYRNAGSDAGRDGSFTNPDAPGASPWGGDNPGGFRVIY